MRLKDPLQPRMMGMDWILAMSKWMLEMEERPACRIPVWLAQGAQDQTVDWHRHFGERTYFFTAPRTKRPLHHRRR